jgi:hypothetical protein
LGGTALDSIFEQHFAIVFPFFFAALWLSVTTLLAVLSGWFQLMAAFPDRAEEPILKIRGQSGAMGLGVSFQSVLRLSVCRSGLRIGMMRVFGPFCRDFFVPWKAITVTRKHSFWGRYGKLEFGNPRVGSLTISAQLADRLRQAAGELWPEPRSLAEEERRGTPHPLLLQWAGATFLAALFFTLAPRLMIPGEEGPPLTVAILFPAIVFGVITLIRYLLQRI